IRNRVSPGALIILYHRVNTLESDPYALSVTPRHFEEQLEVLRRRAKPVPLTELATQLKVGSVEPRSVAITFDYGYLENHDQARPILERLGVPATVFVASGYVGGEREFWWDELDRAVLEPPLLPERLNIAIGGTERVFNLGTAAFDDIRG